MELTYAKRYANNGGNNNNNNNSSIKHAAKWTTHLFYYGCKILFCITVQLITQTALINSAGGEHSLVVLVGIAS